MARRAQPLTLGELIDQLGAVGDKSISIQFDFPLQYPTTFDSWRGIYDELALGYEERDCIHVLPTVQNVLDRAEAAVGETFEGYKGGSFTMRRSTRVWVNNYGDYDDIGITGVIDLGYRAMIATHYFYTL